MAVGGTGGVGGQVAGGKQEGGCVCVVRRGQTLGEKAQRARGRGKLQHRIGMGKKWHGGKVKQGKGPGSGCLPGSLPFASSLLAPCCCFPCCSGGGAGVNLR